MQNKTIVLTTDFGANSPFVGIMKGVIKSIVPHTSILDLTHTISFGNIKEAAFILFKSYHYFPEGSIHVVVVDPGVGTERKILAAYSRGYIFLAPDNGVLSWVLQEDSLVYEVNEESLFLKPVSKTFHGRDIFAPVAAFVSNGLPLSFLGRRAKKFLRIPQPSVRREKNFVEGEILFADSFGNLITSIEEKEIANRKIKRITINEKPIGPLVKSFYEGKDFEMAAIIDSFGNVEIFSYLKSAADMLKEWEKLTVKVEFY